MSTIPPPYITLPSTFFLPFEHGGLLFSARQDVAFRAVALDYTSRKEGWTLVRSPQLKLGVCVLEGEEVEAMRALIHAAWCAGGEAKSRVSPYIDATPSTPTPTRETANTTVRRDDGFGEVEKWVLAIGIPLAIVAVSAIVGLLLLKS